MIYQMSKDGDLGSVLSKYFIYMKFYTLDSDSVRSHRINREGRKGTRTGDRHGGRAGGPFGLTKNGSLSERHQGRMAQVFGS